MNYESSLWGILPVNTSVKKLSGEFLVVKEELRARVSSPPYEEL